jgi:hypothetical protein
MMTGLPISSWILLVAQGGMVDVAFQFVRIAIAIRKPIFRHALRPRPPMN